MRAHAVWQPHGPRLRQRAPRRGRGRAGWHRDLRLGRCSAACAPSADSHAPSSNLAAGRMHHSVFAAQCTSTPATHYVHRALCRVSWPVCNLAAHVALFGGLTLVHAPARSCPRQTRSALSPQRTCCSPPAACSLGRRAALRTPVRLLPLCNLGEALLCAFLADSIHASHAC